MLNVSDPGLDGVGVPEYLLFIREIILIEYQVHWFRPRF